MHRESKKQAKKGSKKGANADIIHVDEMKKHDSNKKNMK